MNEECRIADIGSSTNIIPSTLDKLLFLLMIRLTMMRHVAAIRTITSVLMAGIIGNRTDHRTQAQVPRIQIENIGANDVGYSYVCALLISSHGRGNQLRNEGADGNHG